MKKTNPIYLDYNATTPVDKRVMDSMIPYFTEKFGNASSTQHAFGWDAEEGVDLAREQVAGLIGAKPNEIIFTSGATEAINMALFGVFEGKKNEGNHIITCATEHSAVLDTCSRLEQKGATVTYLPVDKSGLINLSELEESITDQTILISVMHSNNETGVIQPIKKISEIARKHQITLLSDITQSGGKFRLDINDFGIDIAAFSGHKLYGPKGVGALFVNKNSRSQLVPQQYGGGHEKGFRSGTLNVPGIVGFGKACEIYREEQVSESDRLRIFRDQMEQELLQIEGAFINGTKANRLSHVTNITFKNIDGSKLIRTLTGLAVSQGSACSSTLQEPSHVLKAMGLSDELAFSSLRISLGRFTAKEEVKEAVNIIRSAVEQLKLQLK